MGEIRSIKEPVEMECWNMEYGYGRYGIKKEIKNTIGPRQTALKLWGKLLTRRLLSFSKWAPLESLKEEPESAGKTFWRRLKERGD